MDRGPIEILFLIDYFHRTGGTEKHLASSSRDCRQRTFARRWWPSISAPILCWKSCASGVFPVIHLPVAREYVPMRCAKLGRLATHPPQSL